MTESKICTCPSGDGSLRWPCPKHPAVEQAGGDLWDALQSIMEWTAAKNIPDDRKLCLIRNAARAALAQPSPVRSSLLINGYQLRAALDFIAPDGTAEQLESEACIEWRQQDADFLEAGLYAFCAEYPEEGGVLLDEEPTTAQPSPLQSEQAEAERPEVVAYFDRNYPSTGDAFIWSNYEGSPYEPVMTVAQHERIVVAEKGKTAAAMLESHRQFVRQFEEGTAELIAQRDAALARVAELERGKVYVEARQCDECQHGGINDSATGVAACHECDWTGPEPEEDRCPGCQRENCMAAACPQCGARYVLVASEEIAAPVVQAQQLNDLDKQCRDDVARALGLRPNQERGFAWSYLLASIKSCVKASGDSAQAQHSVPEDIMRDAQRYRWLRDQQFYFSFSTENSDAGISSCTAGMSSRFKNLSWVDAAIDSAIAAAPGKEVGHE
ncbi:hypothetical protein ACSRVK_005450 [Pseudomonas aeruginosa]